MISGIDHVVIGVRDLDAAISAYELLLGRSALPRTERDGAATAIIPTGDVAVELMAPAGEGETAERLRAAIDDGGEGLKSLVFSTPDIERAHRRCARVGLAPQEIVVRESWRSFRLDTERTHGARIFILQREAPFDAAPGPITGLDHIVVRSADMERAAALYGARLGLDMRLDRDVAGRRLMFFRCGGAVVEIAEDMDGPKDRLWGLSWRVSEADAERQRLVEAGLNVSDMRPGMKMGTRVFTVRDGTCGVPTLMIEPSRDRD